MIKITIGKTEAPIDYKFPEHYKSPYEEVEFIKDICESKKDVSIQTYSLNILKYLEVHKIECEVNIEGACTTIDKALDWLSVPYYDMFR